MDQDPSGQRQDTYLTFALVYANIKPLVGREYLAAGQLSSDITHDITIRYRRDVKSDMRILFADRVFEVVTPPIDPNERREWLYLKCKEVST
jgi:SPP1 family predicted phage head-tail adaptor